jgi:hypothetical protein
MTHAQFESELRHSCDGICRGCQADGNADKQLNSPRYPPHVPGIYRPTCRFLGTVYMTVAGARRFQGIRTQSLYKGSAFCGQFMYLTVSMRLTMCCRSTREALILGGRFRTVAGPLLFPTGAQRFPRPLHYVLLVHLYCRG